ncbi:choice-of-anchor J domain-containing protein [uncultured Nocardioides sp.]|uniref:choice-of-anchor J domain-containing protein n=1 Tax=uncultured Nocardioides sp. TaxID=198441 RepID=UPI002634C609|nr:choice-of-anchor J domain-containing protein [uncultured Nocardioides sp.]HRD59787.1 choice-of-anchor J domain-containing protein [Nocardioides sp.]
MQLRYARRWIATSATAALVATGLAVSGAVTAPAHADELIVNGGFESTESAGHSSPGWTVVDPTESPGGLFCNSFCAALQNRSHAGDYWLWFGSDAQEGSTTKITQTVTIPEGAETLRYWTRLYYGTAPYEATVSAKIDGHIVGTITEQADSETQYTQQINDIRDYADDESHTLSFEYVNPTDDVAIMYVDDVSIDTAVTLPTTDMPSVDSVLPASTGSSTTPKVRGEAPLFATVTLYGDAACSGPVLASGPAAQFGSSGIPVSVPENTTTTFYARAAKAHEHESDCSTTSVSYTHVPTPTTATPTVLTVAPAGPSSSPNPLVSGTAESGSTVTLYGDATCSGPALGSGSAAQFTGSGIAAAVSHNATSMIRAKSVKQGQFDSACSATSVTYTHDSVAPETTIASGPADRSKSLDVAFTFTAPESPATFRCSLDSAPFAACTSPATMRVTSGPHTFRVAAVDRAGNLDASPAARTFTAYDCVSLQAVVASGRAQVAAATAKLIKAKAAVKKAKKKGNPRAIAKAKKKVKRAKQARAAATAALASASSAASVCSS